MFTVRLTATTLTTLAHLEAAARRLRLAVERWHESACDRAHGSF